MTALHRPADRDPGRRSDPARRRGGGDGRPRAQRNSPRRGVATHRHHLQRQGPRPRLGRPRDRGEGLEDAVPERLLPAFPRRIRREGRIAHSLAGAFGRFSAGDHPDPLPRLPLDPIDDARLPDPAVRAHRRRPRRRDDGRRAVARLARRLRHGARDRRAERDHAGEPLSPSGRARRGCRSASTSSSEAPRSGWRRS